MSINSPMNKVSSLTSSAISNYLTNVQTWGGIIYNVLAYGAVGNGSTDDSSVFNTALNSDSDIIYIPEGRYRITETITARSGRKKRVIGSTNTILSVDLISNTDLFVLDKNVSFENLTIDFNDGNVKTGFVFGENLGIISMQNVKIQNVRDMNNTYNTYLIWVYNSGNTLDFNGVEISSIYKYTTGTEEGVVNGALEGIYIAPGPTAAPISSGTMQNILVNDFHNISLVGAITSVASNAIYLASGLSPDYECNVAINNIRGINFGKRLIKSQVSNLDIDTLYAESNENDCLAVLGLQDMDSFRTRNIRVRNVTIRGKARFCFAISADDVTIDNFDIETAGATLISANPIGFSLAGDNTRITNGTIKVRLGFLGNRAESVGRGAVKNVAISNCTIYSTVSGATAVDWTTVGAEEFENLSFMNITANRVLDSGILFNFGRSGDTSNYLTFTDVTIIDDSASTNVLYGLAATNVNCISYNNFTHILKGGGQVFRTANHSGCNNVQINGMFLAALAAASLTFTNGSNVVCNGILGNSSTSLWIGLTNTNALLGDTPPTKVSFNDAAARNTSSFQAAFSTGTTAQRPTSPTVGMMYWDTTLNKIVWWSGTAWVDAPQIVAVPGSASATGIPGQIAYDSSYWYVCHAANTWKRVAISIW